MTVVGILGLGEAGSAIARDLVEAGVKVQGWDPAPRDGIDGVEQVRGGRYVILGADFVLSINAAAAAVEAAKSVSAVLGPGQVYADLNTAAPGVKREVADAVVPSNFADVALMGTVPGNGISTPALVSGEGAERFAAVFGELGMPVTVVGSEPGEAAARKLARSVVMKGLAAAIGESLGAAEKLGFLDWQYEELERALTEADGRLLRRLVEGSPKHAVRRTEEMAAAVAMLDEVGVEPRVAAAARDWLESLAEAQ